MNRFFYSLVVFIENVNFGEKSADDINPAYKAVHFELTGLLQITFKNRLGPDQTRQNVVPDLDPN